MVFNARAFSVYLCFAVGQSQTRIIRRDGPVLRRQPLMDEAVGS